MTEALLEIDSELAKEESREKIGDRPAKEKCYEVIEGQLDCKEDYTGIDGRSIREENYEESVSRRAKEGHKSFMTRKLGEVSWRQQEGDRIPLAIAWDMNAETVTLEKSVGRRAAEFINLYPPGVPLLVPGEYMTGALCLRIQEAVAQGLTVQGIQTGKNENGSQIILTKVLLCKEEEN